MDAPSNLLCDTKMNALACLNPVGTFTSSGPGQLDQIIKIIPSVEHACITFSFESSRQTRSGKCK